MNSNDFHYTSYSESYYEKNCEYEKDNQLDFSGQDPRVQVAQKHLGWDKHQRTNKEKDQEIEELLKKSCVIL